MIRVFYNEHFWLSNFAPAPMTINGLFFPTLEHAYQAYKAVNEKDRESIRLAVRPGEAKKLGRAVRQSESFERRKVEIMKNLLLKKFSIPYLKTKLLWTGDQELVEGNTWHDNFWGDCTCLKCGSTKGINMLGQLLTEVRGQA